MKLSVFAFLVCFFFIPAVLILWFLSSRIITPKVTTYVFLSNQSKDVSMVTGIFSDDGSLYLRNAARNTWRKNLQNLTFVIFDMKHSFILKSIGYRSELKSRKEKDTLETDTSEGQLLWFVNTALLCQETRVFKMYDDILVCQCMLTLTKQLFGAMIYVRFNVVDHGQNRDVLIAFSRETVFKHLSSQTPRLHIFKIVKPKYKQLNSVNTYQCVIYSLQNDALLLRSIHKHCRLLLLLYKLSPSLLSRVRHLSNYKYFWKRLLTFDLLEVTRKSHIALKSQYEFLRRQRRKVPPCDQWAVTTSCSNIASSLVVSIASRNETCVVVVSNDKMMKRDDYIKSVPSNIQHRIQFLSYSDQTNLYPVLSDIIPWKHVARRNIGYLFAIQNGAKSIVEFDDVNITADNLPHPTGSYITACVSSRHSSMFNPNTYLEHQDNSRGLLFTTDVDLTSPEVFDGRFYVNNYHDLHSIHNEAGAKAHWLHTGIQEGRQGCGKFHSKQYLHRYSDLKKAFNNDYRAAIQHYLTNGIHENRFGYVEGGFDGRWTISNGRNLFVSVSSRMGGAVDSLVWNNTEMINMYDHGRELQMASNSDTYTECYNPTEAGGRDDGTQDTTNTHIQWIRAHGHYLASEVHPAFWLRPGTHETQNTHTRCNAGSPAKNLEKTYAYPFSKEITIGVNGVQNAIKYVSNFTLAGDWPNDLSHIQMEAPACYIPGDFSHKYYYNIATHQMETVHRHQSNPAVLATTDGQIAIGGYAPAGQDSDAPMYYGSTTFNIHSYAAATSKWNVVYRKRRFASGINHQVYTTYICVGTLDMVANCLHKMNQWYPHI